MNIENVILACLLIDRSIHDMVIPLLKPEYFTAKREGLFKLIKRMYSRNEPIDTYSLIAKIGTNNETWSITDLTSLSDMIASTANVMSYVQQLKLTYQRRVLSNNYGIQMTDDADPGERLSELLRDLEALQQEGVISKNRDIVDIVEDALRDIDTEKKTSGMIGIPTSIGAFNSETRGLRGGELVVIAGRPGHGKTALALSFTKAACLHGRSVCFFTLEMRDSELVKRMIRSYNQEQEGADDISKMKLHIFDRGGIDVDYIRSNTRLTRGVDMVIIDYLGLMRVDARKKRTEAIGDVTRALKAFALEVNIPIILLSQLNREVESRSDWKHKLSDLRESGDIEQDADKVLFVNSPKIMDKDVVTVNGQEVDTEGLTIIQKLKDRNGKAPVYFKTKHNETYTEFYDYSDAPF